jgi:hypothetical protein
VRRRGKAAGDGESGQWGGRESSPVQSSPTPADAAAQAAVTGWLEGKCARQATHATDTGTGTDTPAPIGAARQIQRPGRNRGGFRRPQRRPGSAFRAEPPPDRLAASPPPVSAHFLSPSACSISFLCFPFVAMMAVASPVLLCNVCINF